MKRFAWLFGSTAFLASPALFASGLFGFCGIVEKVQFEPDDAKAERIRVFGAFASSIADEQGRVRGFGLTVDFEIPAERGYLYFTMPTAASPAVVELLHREWRDIAAVAGTGEAICFGVFDTSAYRSSRELPRVIPLSAGGESEPPSAPIVYQTAGIGLVKLGTGNYDRLWESLNELLGAGSE